MLEELGHDPTSMGGNRGEDTIIELRRCPVLLAAEARPIICELERRAIAAHLPLASVERTGWRLAGDATCIYRAREGAGDREPAG
jgi:predicted ArsR family transcriptional regulator